MRQLKLFRWAAVLMLAIALAPGAASAQEADTITISSTFYMDWLVGTVGPDLAEVFANGHEHTWTLTLYGTSQSHETFTNPFGVTGYATEIHATSFDLEFFGPDAATLNGIVSDHIAGGDVLIYLDERVLVGDRRRLRDHVRLADGSRLRVLLRLRPLRMWYALSDRRGRLPRRGAGPVLDLERVLLAGRHPARERRLHPVAGEPRDLRRGRPRSDRPTRRL